MVHKVQTLENNKTSTGVLQEEEPCHDSRKAQQSRDEEGMVPRSSCVSLPQSIHILHRMAKTEVSILMFQMPAAWAACR
jgi:hypothetical protein